MRGLAVDWTAVGSVGTGAATIAAFLAIAATIAVYYFQSRRDRADAIRQNLQFIHGQQVQVLWLLNLGLMATINKQIRDFKERLCSSAESSYFIHQLFGNHALFCSSAADSNLSSDAYSRMSSTWDQINTKAFEFRGALRIFSYSCRALIDVPYRLCDPNFTVSILDAMVERSELAALGRIDSLDELANRVITDLTLLAAERFEDTYRQGIEEGSVFIGMLADMIAPATSYSRRLLLVGGENVQGRLRLQAAHDPQSVPLAAADEVIGEDASVVVAAGGHIEMERRAAGENHAVGDPARPTASADGFLHYLDRLVGIPVVGEPAPVSIALASARIRDRAVGIGHGERSAVPLHFLDQCAEEWNHSAVIKLCGLRQEHGARRDVHKGDHPRARGDGFGARTCGVLAHHADTLRLVYQVVKRKLYQLPRSAIDRLESDAPAVLATSCRRPPSLHVGADLQPGKQRRQPGTQAPSGRFLKLLRLARRDLQLNGSEGGPDDSIVESGNLSAVNEHRRIRQP